MTAPHQSLLGTSGAVADTEETDAEFNETVLLLHGDGTNGGQNNTFVDSSTNNLSITRTGTPTQGTFNPFLGDGYYSTFFDGSANLQKTTSPFATNLSTFTIEAWIYMTSDPTGSSSHSGLVGMNVLTDHNNHLSWGPTTSRKLQLFWYSGSNKTCTGSTTLDLNRWYFISLVVNSNAISMQVDGVAETLTGTTTLTNRTSLHNFIIGANGQTQFIGYTTNIRISDNARTITVPSTPLTEDSNTLFLYCGDNRFKDPADGTESVSFDVFGGEVIPFSPYAPTASYSESVHGGSGYFDGSGDYLSVAHSGSLQLSTNPFIIEAWVYPTECSGNESIIASGPGAATNHWLLWLSNGQPSWVIYTSSSPTTLLSSGVTLPKNAWAHILVTRDSSNDHRIYVNGVQKATANSSAPPGTTSNVTIGAQGSANQFQGYITGARMDLGVSQDSNFTIPSAPKTATGNDLLVNFTNASIIDSTMKHNLITYGNTQIDTSVKKFGTGAILFDGTDDYIEIPDSPLLDYGNGDFTLEFFINRDDTATMSIFHKTVLGGDTPGNVAVRVQAGNVLVQIDDNNSWPAAATLTGSTSVTTDAFTHVAVVRNGNTVTLFINGTSDGSVSFSSATSSTTDSLYISYWRTGDAQFIDGHLDEVRISRVARYSGSSFTPPVKAFANR